METTSQGLAVLDDTDRAIVAILRDDARISNVELADRVGLSPSPCLRRVRRLEEEGVLLGYRAVIAPAYDERGLSVWVGVRVRVHEHGLVQRIEEEVVRLPGVTEVHDLAGDWDYLVRVEVPDLAAYHRFTRDVLPRLPGIGHVTSFVVLATLRDDDRGIGTR